jgi:DNA-binding CsgD family transcriptional regulator
MVRLRILSVLIDTVASVNFNTPREPVRLSKREEQCLIWTARGKTFQDIAEILGISHSSVKCYLDTARHKLNCVNLTHAVAVAVASGLIPSRALR